MPWPTVTDYQEVIQNPRICFSDSELRTSSPMLTPLGLPKPISGNFASVYQMKCGDRKFAVRCFLRHFPDQEQRYKEISNHLNQNRLQYMVNFIFIAQGIRVKGNWYPILKMEWIEGEQLDKYIEKNLNNPGVLSKLATNFCQLVSDLRNCSIAHCDLQHGNILVINGNLRLIDYDGMFVPGLSRKPSHELGHINFQHPRRTEGDFGLHVDSFSSWVIYLSLLVVSINPNIWRRLKAGDESLLFQRKDFEYPDSSITFHALEQINDQRLQPLIKQFRSFMYCNDISQISPLPDIDKETPEELLINPTEQPKTQTMTQPTGASWLWDHIPMETKAIDSTFRFERAFLASLVFSLLVLITISASKLIPVMIFPLTGIGLTCVSFFFLFRRFRSLPVVLERKEKISEFRLQERGYKKIQNEMKDQESKRQKLLKDEKEILDRIESDRVEYIAKIDLELNSLSLFSTPMKILFEKDLLMNNF